MILKENNDKNALLFWLLCYGFKYILHIILDSRPDLPTVIGKCIVSYLCNDKYSNIYKDNVFIQSIVNELPYLTKSWYPFVIDFIILNQWNNNTIQQFKKYTKKLSIDLNKNDKELNISSQNQIN